MRGRSYINMDYAFWTAVLLTGVTIIVASYDIACQWSVNLHPRAKKRFPEQYAIIATLAMICVIPNFHLHGHGPRCQEDYSLHFTECVGLSHMETVEQEWGHIGPVATSTKEMGPGARHATLDDHWSGWNFRKIVGFGNFRSVMSELGLIE